MLNLAGNCNFGGNIGHDQKSYPSWSIVSPYFYINTYILRRFGAQIAEECVRALLPVLVALFSPAGWPRWPWPRPPAAAAISWPWPWPRGLRRRLLARRVLAIRAVEEAVLLVRAAHAGWLAAKVRFAKVKSGLGTRYFRTDFKKLKLRKGQMLSRNDRTRHICFIAGSFRVFCQKKNN